MKPPPRFFSLQKRNANPNNWAVPSLFHILKNLKIKAKGWISLESWKKLCFFFESDFLRFHPGSPRLSSWWLNQPIWKICSSNCKSSPIFGVNIKNVLKPPPSYSRNLGFQEVGSSLNLGFFSLILKLGFLYYLNSQTDFQGKAVSRCSSF